MTSQVLVKAPALDERYDLLKLALQCLDALAFDDLWTEAASTKNPVGREIGSQLIDELTSISERCGQARRVIGNFRDEVNAYWPALRERLLALAGDEVKQFDRWVEQYDGLGNAGDAVAASLPKVLDEEVKRLAEEIVHLGGAGEAQGDLLVSTKVLLGVLVVSCVLTASLPIVAASVTATGLLAGGMVGVASLSGMAASIAGGALIKASEPVKGPPPPTV